MYYIHDIYIFCPTCAILRRNSSTKQWWTSTLPVRQLEISRAAVNVHLKKWVEKRKVEAGRNAAFCLCLSFFLGGLFQNLFVFCPNILWCQTQKNAKKNCSQQWCTCDFRLQVEPERKIVDVSKFKWALADLIGMKGIWEGFYWYQF